MGHSKLSVTIPDEIYDQIDEIASERKIKLSHLVTGALVEKLRIKREQDYLQLVDEVNKDANVAEEQYRMAEIISDNTSVDELPDPGYWILDAGCFWISSPVHSRISSIKHPASSRPTDSLVSSPNEEIKRFMQR